MKVFVKAKAGQHQEKVEKISDNSFAVSVTARAEKGLANAAITRALAAYFGVSQSKVTLVSGYTSKTKLFEIS